MKTRTKKKYIYTYIHTYISLTESFTNMENRETDFKGGRGNKLKRGNHKRK